MAEFLIDRDGDLRIAGTHTVVVVPADQVAELRELIAPAAEPAYRWYINGNGDLAYDPSCGDSYVMDFDLAEHEGFSRIDARALGEWFVQHQPAISEDDRIALTDQDNKEGSHESSRSARILLDIKARIDARSAPARIWWRIRQSTHVPALEISTNNGAYWTGVYGIYPCSEYTAEDAQRVAQWLVDTQREPAPDDITIACRQPGHICYAHFRSQMDAAQPAEPAAPAAAAEPLHWRTGNDDEDGLYLSIRNPMPNDQDEEWPVMFWIKDVEPADRARARYVAAWLVDHQPVPPAGAVQLSYDEDSHACAIAMSVHVDNLQAAANAEPLPFTPDRAEVSDDPAFWQQVAEKTHAIIEDVINEAEHAPRLVHVSFTFDPADICAAKMVYGALELLPYEIRKAVEIR